MMATVGWTLLVGLVRGGYPRAVVALLVATTSAFMLCRLAGTVDRAAVPGLLLVVGSIVAVAAGDDLFSREALSGPFGYSTARAAFFVPVAMAGLIVASASSHAVLKMLGLGGAVVAAAVVLATTSIAAAVVLLGLPALSLLAWKSLGANAAVSACAVLFLTALSATVILGATYRTGAIGGEGVAAPLTERRLALWGDALALMKEHPITGVGTGHFRYASPTARSDSDARWAHNEFLEQGAETGVIGLALTVLLVGWGFLRLAAAPPDAVTVLAAAAVAAVGIHASIDYILHFPAVPLAVAALVGGATAHPRNDGDDARDMGS